jgi:hypothetical protein
MTIKKSRPTMSVPKDEDGPLDKEYEELVTRTLERWNVPGVAVAVVDGEMTYARVSIAAHTSQLYSFLI